MTEIHHDIGLRSLMTAASTLAPQWVRGRVSILIYHRVRPGPQMLMPGELDVETFEWHVELLSQHFNVLRLSDAVYCLRSGRIPPRAVCLTFDDGYADHADLVLPILQRHRVPASFFIASAYLDGGAMWNDVVIEAVRSTRQERLDLEDMGLGAFDIRSADERRRAVLQLIPALKNLDPGQRSETVAAATERLGVQVETSKVTLRTEQVRRLYAADMEVGGHTHTHPILARVDDRTARDDILAGKERLEDIVRGPVRYFAYPVGRPGVDYGSQHVELVRQAGYEAAVTTSWGVSTPRSDQWQLPRFTPWDRTPLWFLLRLLRNGMQTTPSTA